MGQVSIFGICVVWKLENERSLRNFFHVCAMFRNEHVLPRELTTWRIHSRHHSIFRLFRSNN